jgi:lipopolysaccharide/colanic/teichoic acid biosynthesis glycosyltransferase
MVRVGDLLIAVVLIALTLPLMVIVALAIKLDSPGPVLSKREQWGFQGHKFSNVQIPYRKPCFVRV